MPSSIIGAIAAPIVGGIVGDVLGLNDRQDNANDAAANANNQAADATALQAQIAKDQWNRYKQTYAPLENKMVADAQNYDTPEKYNKAASEASADVGLQFAKARDRLTRTPGLDPSSAGYASSMVGLNLAQAATDATAQNKARIDLGQRAYARRVDALSLGKGLPASATTGLASAASASNGIAANQLRLAGMYQDQANQVGSTVGRVVDRVVSSPTVSNWLGNVGKGGSSGGFQTDTNDYFDPGYANA